MKDYALYEKPDILDIGFPVKINSLSYKKRGMIAFTGHWHEEIEILYFVQGKAVVKCDSQPLKVVPGDVVFINSNVIHEGYSLTENLIYYCIIFSTSFLKGDFNENCEQKYITPIIQNLIQFRNKISGDAEVTGCIEDIMTEWREKLDGYELLIKSSVYRLLGIYYRKYTEKILTEKEYASRINNLERLNRVISFIDKNYMNPMTIAELAQMLCISKYHFCHVFKNLTGKGVNEYINMVRVEQAERLLKNTDMNITEIAMATGFSDANYFSRVFSKYKKIPPSSIRKAGL